MQQRHKTSNGKLCCVWLKPYEITVDGEIETVKGDMVVGTFSRSAEKDGVFFSGALFDGTGRHCGSISLSAREYLERTETFREIVKCKTSLMI